MAKKRKRVSRQERLAETLRPKRWQPLLDYGLSALPWKSYPSLPHTWGESRAVVNADGEAMAVMPAEKAADVAAVCMTPLLVDLLTRVCHARLTGDLVVKPGTGLDKMLDRVEDLLDSIDEVANADKD